MAYVMALPEWYIFASDAAVYILCGVALLLVSGLAAWRDHRRRQRKNIDRVPLLPWRDIGALSLFGGLILCAFGAMGLLTG
ncbi:hypothetical protein AAW01_04495 [Aurantiacibacter gangjinensis]|uniref:Uncharacterized protein n=2 Tax=Aurantiacibacter gangjinensis TaxID=502682 RepID=A0A0G9MRP9_9SPHN|nr:hypothetical protein AAW01_04495 [Aurantiacibacter gangjinensis]